MTSILPTIAVAASLALTAVAQNDYNLDKTTPATLGGALNLGVTGAPPGALMMVMASFGGGPTPVAIVDPTDPRSVQVGTESSGNWFVLLTSPTGTASFGLNLPLLAIHHGAILHWQTLTLPGVTTVVDKISNDVVSLIGLPDTAQPTPTNLLSARAFAAMAATNTPRDVLVVGGGAGALTAATGLATTERWDSRHLTRSAGPNMATARALHIGVTLADGRTLMVGGVNAVGTVLSSCEIYDPVSNTFSPTASMVTPRVLHAAARMADGRVIVAGGTSSLLDTTTAISSTLDSVETWSPLTGTWSLAPVMGGRRLAPALTPLSTGRTMCSGGVQVTVVAGFPVAAASTTAVQLFNPGTNTWSAGTAMPFARAGHHFNQVTLADNRVLMTGGVNLLNLLVAASAAPIANADLYNPGANTWAAGTMAAARSLHSASRLPDGRVVVCGGAQGTLTAPTSIAGVEIFNPTTNAWAGLPPLLAPRASHVATVQPDGLLILFGGQDSVGTTTSIAAIHF